MVETKEHYDEFLEYVEKDVHLSDARDSDELITKMKHSIGYMPSTKQKKLLFDYAREHDIPLIRKEKPKPIGITKRKGKPKEELRRHYTQHRVKGKSRIVARIPKGKKGAGRFAKRG